uniref:Uncharacterized protein n=1 Tax=viral metagenome TaxID=1070528 RepID=A0A6C0HCY9_9ZZZZ
MSTEEPITKKPITEEESKRMLAAMFEFDDSGKFKVPTSNLSDCGGDFNIEENQTLNGLVEQLQNSSERIGIALFVLLLSIQDVAKMIIQEKTEYMSIMDSGSQDSDSMRRIAQIEMKIRLYSLFISEGFDKLQLLVSSRTRIDYFYDKFTLVLNGLSEHFPGCGEETMSALLEKLPRFESSIESEQLGGQGKKILKLFLAFMAALSLLVVSTRCEMNARLNASETFEMKKGVSISSSTKRLQSEPTLNALGEEFDKVVAISNTSLIAFSTTAEMNEALEQVIAVEVTGAIKNSSDPNIKGIYGKTPNLRTVIVEISRANKDSIAVDGADYGLSSIDVANIIQLINVVSNDGREIFDESVNEINKLSKKAFEETDKLITTITLTLKDMITSLSYLDVSNEKDQVILFKINEAIEKFLIENGVSLSPSQAISPGSLMHEEASAAVEPATLAPVSSVLTGFAKAYQLTAAVLGKDAAKAIAYVVASDEFKGEVKGNAQARQQNKEQVKQAQSKRVELTEKASKSQQDIASRLTILAAMGRFEAMPVQFSYNSEKNEVTVNVTGNYRGEVLSFFKDKTVAPLLSKARQDAAADKHNYWSQLTENQREFFKLAQSLEERLVIGGEALSMLNNAVFATAQKTDNTASLLDITGRKMREAVELLLLAQKEKPLTDIRAEALLQIDEEEAKQAEKAANQYWNSVNSKISSNMRGSLGAVRSVTKEGWYGIAAGFLGALAGISEATKDSYMEYPTITIVAAGFCGSLVFFLMSLATEMMGINALIRTSIKVGSNVLTSTPMAIILSSLVSLQVYKEFEVRLPELVGGPAVPGLTPQEMFFNNLILYLFKISNIEGCNDGVCFSPPGKTEIIFMLGGFIAIVTWGTTKIYKIITGTPSAEQRGRTQERRRREGGQNGGAKTCPKVPFRKILFTGKPNLEKPSEVVPDNSGAIDGDSGGSAKPHRTKHFTNKNRKMNKTKKPKSTLNKNKKPKYNSSRNKNKNKKNRNTNTRKHKRTIRRK